MATKLPKSEFLKVVRNAPLVAIDLIIYDEKGRIGLGLRKNNPAKGTWYFPGGRIFKGEKVAEAAGRILLEELGVKRDQIPLQISGVNDWFFDTNFAGVKGVSTHYVALAMEVEIKSTEIDETTMRIQHDGFKWFTESELGEEDKVHLDVLHVIRHLAEKKKQ